MTASTCRSCGTMLEHLFLDLGISPLANSYLKPEQLSQGESFFPLRAYVCSRCFLVQLEEFETPENIFSDYAYFSSFSESWLKHARDYVEFIITRLSLTPKSFVVEIASNDGYLLKNFLPHKIPVLGIEPAVNVARVAIQNGVPTLSEFFGQKTAQRIRSERGSADLIAANNVFAHVPKLNDFILGFKELLAPEGVITIEFPHLLELFKQNLFDTIYHEHFSYFSLTSARNALMAHGLEIFDVQKLSTHGGSLRLFVCHVSSRRNEVSLNVKNLLQVEREAGFEKLEAYQGFEKAVLKIKYDLLKFLINAKENGKQIVAYGAPAKGNTLLNYCGVKSDLVAYTVDKSPYKQGHYLPGTRLPIFSPERILKTRPDYVLILPWNIKEEIMNQLNDLRSWGGKFVVAHPQLQVL